MTNLPVYFINSEHFGISEQFCDDQKVLPGIPPALLKFIYSEKATNFCKISTIDLTYISPVKSTVDILQNFEAFSEHMKFNIILLI